MSEFDKRFACVARGLADVLMRYARERRDDDRKGIAHIHTELCQIRRAELSAAPSADPDASSSEQ